MENRVLHVNTELIHHGAEIFPCCATSTAGWTIADVRLAEHLSRLDSFVDGHTEQTVGYRVPPSSRRSLNVSPIGAQPRIRDTLNMRAHQFRGR
jgi:hypothetical protein